MDKINGIPIENTYCEAFDGLFARLLITAKDKKGLNPQRAAQPPSHARSSENPRGGLKDT